MYLSGVKNVIFVNGNQKCSCKLGLEFAWFAVEAESSEVIYSVGHVRGLLDCGDGTTLSYYDMIFFIFYGSLICCSTAVYTKT